MSQEHIHTRGIAVMGRQAVGKSSLTRTFVDGQFPEFYQPTIQDTLLKDMTLQGRSYRLEIRDTAGQDEYSVAEFPDNFYLLDGYVIVYSIEDRKSLEVAKAIYERLLDRRGGQQNRLPLVLVGNKKDLGLNRAIKVEEGQNLAKQMRARFMESSALQNENVSEVFIDILKEIEISAGNIPPERGSSKCSIS